MLEIVQLPVLQDNYLYLLHDRDSGETAVVDPAVDQPVEAACAERGWTLSHIFNTHHHWDHTGANLKLKEKHGLTIVGPAAERDRIPGIDIAVGDGDHVHLGESSALVYDVPGHTSGHIAYYFDADQALFCGDTLFSMGCGRLFEGSPETMWTSLCKLMQLPDETRIYCAHEYTEANGRFALSVDPANHSLQDRMAEVRALRAKGHPTIPSTLGVERATNPFLRAADENLQTALDMVGAPPVRVFAETRRRKDHFS